MDEYKKRKVWSKAEAAAVTVQNMKVKKVNDFYLFNKEIIDEFFRLQEEAQEAMGDTVTAQINTLYERFPPKNSIKK